MRVVKCTPMRNFKGWMLLVIQGDETIKPGDVMRDDGILGEAINQENRPVLTTCGLSSDNIRRWGSQRELREAVRQYNIRNSAYQIEIVE